MKTIFLIWFGIVYSYCSYGQGAANENSKRIFILQKQTDHADFDYVKLQDIDKSLEDSVSAQNPQSVFESVKGVFKYYQFLTTYRGEEKYAESPMEFHDILIVKTDGNNIIIDAYMFTLEWAELPRQYDLFRSSSKGVPLIYGMDVKQLELKRVYENFEGDEGLTEIGVIELH